jgi:hypothetical protein
MVSGFSLNQAFRQTSAVQAFARLSWRPDPVNHVRLARRCRLLRQGGGCSGAHRSSEPPHVALAPKAPIKSSAVAESVIRVGTVTRRICSVRLVARLCDGARRADAAGRRKPDTMSTTAAETSKKASAMLLSGKPGWAQASTGERSDCSSACLLSSVIGGGSAAGKATDQLPVSH